MAPGFQHGHIFKITSVRDRKVLQVANGQIKQGAPLVTGQFGNAPHQKFRSEQIPHSPHQFRILPLTQPGPAFPHVWDYVSGQGLVLLNNASHSINQIWTTEPVHQGNVKVVFIKATDGMCLRNMGTGKAVELVPQNWADPMQHWQLDSTTSY